MGMLLQDLRYGGRQLLRAPGFAAVAIAALAIGIGANTAIFSVVNTLLIRPLPYADADRLALVWEHNTARGRRGNVVGPANYVHWRDLQRSFEEMAAISSTLPLTVTGDGDPEEVMSQLVSWQFFPVLGVQPALGRVFAAEEDRPGSRVAVISERLWKRRFNSDPGILDRPVTIQGVPYTVLGVMPDGFSFMDKRVDVWAPIAFTEATRTRRGRSLQVVARLKDGVSVAAAHEDIVRVHAELTRLMPEFNTGWSAEVVPLREQLTGPVRPALFVLLGAVGFVLLIACANVANLLMARATGRQRELAVRAALGAGRWRLVRQLMAESLLLAAIGGAAGLCLGWWAVHLLRAFVAQRLDVQRLDAVAIDGWVLAFTAGVAVLSGVLFGMFPALMAAGAELTDALKQGGRGGTAGRGNRARSAFVVVEVALALILLTGAGLLIRSFTRLMDVDAGFDPSRTITFDIGLPGSRYQGPPQVAGFFRRLFERVDALPGVEASGAISFLPLTGLASATGYAVVGEPAPPPGHAPVTDVRAVSHDYFRAMNVPLVRGRLFTHDEADAAGRIVINEAMARRHWPGRDPIGQRLRISWGASGEDEVIGVVGDTRHEGLASEPRPTIYWPHLRLPYGAMTVTVRTAGDPRTVLSAVTAAVRELDPQLAVADVRTMQQVVDDSVAQQRVTTTVLGVFAAAALLLAAVGIYGVIAFTVTERTQEIGIRMALGASRAAVLRMVVGRALLLASIGVVLGAAGAVVLTRFMAGMLFGVTPTDPATFVAVAAVLFGVAAVAGYVPGRRATRVDPVVALRAD